MIKDVVKIFTEDYSRESFTLTLPSCFDNLSSSDANFEMVASNELQPLRLVYKKNIASKTIACIFVHTKTKDLTYDGATERGEMHKTLFKDVFNFDEVNVHTDISKDDMIEVLSSLKTCAEQFEKGKGENDNFVVAIANIGFNMVHDYAPHKAIFDELTETYKKIEKAEDESSFEEQYALTSTGEPIAIPEYTCRIS